MSKTVYLFCEGGNGGLDMQLLKKIPFANTVIVQPFGGKGGQTRYMDGFADYAKSLGTSSPNSFIGFRDRDFDFPLPKGSHASLTKASNNVYAGYRITLENYLLSSEVFYYFINDPGHVAKFGHLGSSPQEIKNLIFDPAAKDIIYFQSARNALGAIRNPKAIQRTNFYFIENSGKLPPSLLTDSCRINSYRTLKLFKKEASLYSKTRFIKYFDVFYSLFQKESFWNSSQYLLYFHGKDLAKAIQKRLPINFPMKSYYQYSINNFNYATPGFEDLVELKKIIDSI